MKTKVMVWKNGEWKCDKIVFMSFQETLSHLMMIGGFKKIEWSGNRWNRRIAMRNGFSTFILEAIDK